VTPRKGVTPYAGAGDLPVVVLCLLVVAAFWLRTRPS
jgi:apolipoprotein N-acyltransferase